MWRRVRGLAAGGQALFVRGHVQVAAVLLGLAAAAFGVPLRRALKRHASQLEASRGHEPPLHGVFLKDYAPCEW